MDMLATLKTVLFMVAIPTMVFFLFAAPFSFFPFYVRRWRLRKIATRFSLNFNIGEPWLATSPRYERNIIFGNLSGRDVRITDYYCNDAVDVSVGDGGTLGTRGTDVVIESKRYVRKGSLPLRMFHSNFLSAGEIQSVFEALKEGSVDNMNLVASGDTRESETPPFLPWYLVVIFITLLIFTYGLYHAGK